jgi:mediator of RNA polymerase II transcription subunit 14
MTGQRVAILDGSHSLFLTRTLQSLPTPADADTTQPSASSGSRDQDLGDSTLGLQPIPGFNEIILDAIREVASTGTLGKIASIDVGVVCDTSAVRAIGRAIHDRVRARLTD